MRYHAYDSNKIYKAKVKSYHDKKIIYKDFKVGKIVFLFNSRLKLFPGKLKSKWSELFVMKEVKHYGALGLEDPVSKEVWTVNGQRLKIYLGGEFYQGTVGVSPRG